LFTKLQVKIKLFTIEILGAFGDIKLVNEVVPLLPAVGYVPPVNPIRFPKAVLKTT
jgi:hypothetical protein